MSAAEKSQISFPSKITMSAADYHAHPAIGSTTLRDLALSTPAHVKAAKERPKDPTAAMRFGTAFHFAILEPRYFQKNYVVKPAFEGKGAHARRDQWMTENHGKIQLSEDDLENITGMLNSVSRHPLASKIVAAGHAEESYFWIDADTGLPCKCRTDFRREGRIIVDAKSTEDASKEGWAKEIANRKLHIQGAHYTEGVSAVEGANYDIFIHLAVEKFYPWALQCHRMPAETMEEGHRLVKKHRAILKQCLDTNIWPAYSNDLVETGLPPWGFEYV